VEQDESEDHECKRGGDEHAGPVPLDLPREEGDPVGARPLGAHHEDLDRDIAANPHHRKEDVEGEEPLVGVAADYGEWHSGNLPVNPAGLEPRDDLDAVHEAELPDERRRMPLGVERSHEQPEPAPSLLMREDVPRSPEKLCEGRALLQP
jgi:hypothetical protein